jgi:hypothetical protein
VAIAGPDDFDARGATTGATAPVDLPGGALPGNRFEVRR